MGEAAPSFQRCPRCPCASPVALQHCIAADPLRTFKVRPSSPRPPGGSRCPPLRGEGRRRRNTSAGKVSCTSSSRGERPQPSSAAATSGAAVLLAAVGAAYQSSPASFFLIPQRRQQQQTQHSLLLLPKSPSPTITDHVRICLRSRRTRRLISESSKQHGRTEGPSSPSCPLLLLVVFSFLICRSLRCVVDNRGAPHLLLTLTALHERERTAYRPESNLTRGHGDSFFFFFHSRTLPASFDRSVTAATLPLLPRPPSSASYLGLNILFSVCRADSGGGVGDLRGRRGSLEPFSSHYHIIRGRGAVDRLSFPLSRSLVLGRSDDDSLPSTARAPFHGRRRGHWRMWRMRQYM